MIRKLASGEYRLHSRKKDPKTRIRRNLGTFKTRAVAEKHERVWIGFDLNRKYAELQKERTAQRSLPLSRQGDRIP